MGTNLHNIKFPMISRIQRIKSLYDQRKRRRSQVFLNHRLRHYLASNDEIGVRFHAIYEHLNVIGSYSMEQKCTALLLVMISQTPQIADFIRIEWTSELIGHTNDELNVLVSSVCNILNEITINYLLENKYNNIVHFECDNLTFRPNVNSISNLLAELLSQLLSTYSQRCKTTKIPCTKAIFDAFELCYHQFSLNRIVMQTNLDTIFTLTQGIGRFDRTKAIVEHEAMMQRLICNHINDSSESLVVLKIINSITEGFPENIHHLLRLNMLDLLKNQMDTNQHSPSLALIEQCLYVLENICGNHRSDIQAVIDAGLILPLFNVFKYERNEFTENLQKIALNTFYNISTLGSIEQLGVLLDLGLLRLLCCQLNYKIDMSEDVIETILEVLKNVLNDFYRKDHKKFHMILFHLITECDGYGSIEQIARQHDNESISNLAYQLTKYNITTCQKCKNISSEITMEFMQQ